MQKPPIIWRVGGSTEFRKFREKSSETVLNPTETFPYSLYWKTEDLTGASSVYYLYADTKMLTTNRYYLVTLSHVYQRIIYVASVANWFISKRFQNKDLLTFAVFIKEMKIPFWEEKPNIANASSLRSIWSPLVGPTYLFNFRYTSIKPYSQILFNWTILIANQVLLEKQLTVLILVYLRSLLTLFWNF